MLDKWKAGLIVLTLWLALPTFGAQLPERAEKSTVVVSQDDSVRKILIDLESAIASKSVDNTIGLFASDAIFIDQGGDELRGHQAFRERFTRLFQAPTAPAIGIHPQNISMPADHVAVVVGEVSRKQGQADLPVSRFVMVMIKKNGHWLISEVTETAMRSMQAENHLQELDWLIGQWLADKPDASAKLDVEWAPSKKFIISKCTLTKKGMDPQIDSQVIGWDPQRNAIISWHFDSNGGFGNGTWTRHANENQWKVDVVGVSADGSNSFASNVFSLKSSDEFAWQSIQRSLDGIGVDDTDIITVNRVKK